MTDDFVYFAERLRSVHTFSGVSTNRRIVMIDSD